MRKCLPILALFGLLLALTAAPRPAEAGLRIYIGGGYPYYGPYFYRPYAYRPYVYRPYYYRPYYRPYRYYYGVSPFYPGFYPTYAPVYRACNTVRVKRYVKGKWRWRTVRRCW